MEAEMSRYHIKNADIQSLLDCTDKTVSNKISGTTEFSVREAIKIRDSFFLGIGWNTYSARTTGSGTVRRKAAFLCGNIGKRQGRGSPNLRSAGHPLLGGRAMFHLIVGF